MLLFKLDKDASAAVLVNWKSKSCSKAFRIIIYWVLDLDLYVYGSSVWIQKFSLSIKLWFRISIGFFVLVSLPIIMNFACLLKLWLSSWKCFRANMVWGWGFFASFLRLFRVILKGVCAFPILSNIWHLYWNDLLREKSYMFSVCVDLES